ncbi:PREDICTED: histone deacetylase HDT1-like [Nelumbo nucifera]|uniref:Histone deacetylase HDT1-like n=1 Tax=Nelumbo nucifera TaxID=4432 RepID=A0A1U8BLQ1_NELNU|nr:PREDICTED: histone deacetylase HDT1-like [Nelumbo nucifera]
MEFWGVEVKGGEPLKVQPGDDKILHLSQVALGEIKNDKGNAPVLLSVKIEGQKIVLGTLSAEKCTHMSLDLVFEKEFELSHNWKNGSVYFSGYKSIINDDELMDDFTNSESDFDEETPLTTTQNGKPERKDEQAKVAANKSNAAKPDSAAKPKVKIVEPNKDDKSKEDESDDSDGDDDFEDDDDDSEDESDDEEMLDAGDESDEDDDEEEGSDEEDEETPKKKAELVKKRGAESASKTPTPGKKAKLVTPQKTDGKKSGGHTATPFPKQGGKTPANSAGKKQQQTPTSDGQVSCKSCNKTFKSEIALQSHTKAKHAAAK